jgi:hypothetical protein
MFRKDRSAVRLSRYHASRVFDSGQPDDTGPMVASLLSEDNRRVNGQPIEASGGMNI